MNEIEKEILAIIRDLKPYEVIEITKDQQGRPDYYIVRRSQKIIIKQSIDLKL